MPAVAELEELSLRSAFAFRIACILLAVSFAAPSTETLAKPLRPQGSWIINFDDAECTALRKFGTADDPIDFMIRPAFNGQSFELFVGRKASGTWDARTRRGTVDVGSGALRSWFVVAKPKSGGMLVTRVRVADAQFRSANAQGRIRLAVGADDFNLEAGNLNQVLKTLDGCVADLRKFWNEGQVQIQPAENAEGGVRSIFTADDYPAEALMENVEGAVQYTLLIDEKGAVKACDPILATDAPLLELMGCQVILARARFKPATDASGNPARQTLITPPIRWTLQ